MSLLSGTILRLPERLRTLRLSPRDVQTRLVPMPKSLPDDVRFKFKERKIPREGKCPESGICPLQTIAYSQRWVKETLNVAPRPAHSVGDVPLCAEQFDESQS